MTIQFKFAPIRLTRARVRRGIRDRVSTTKDAMTNASTNAERPPRATTAVVVMGDFGRSPRMQYHALSLADDADRDVVVVSTRGTTPIREIVEHEGVRRVEVTTGEWSMTANWPTALALIARAAAQCAHLLYALLTMRPRPREVLIQNPPCIPTFFACGLACSLRGMRMVIDWHNLGYTLFGLKHGRASRATKFCEWYERTLGAYWPAKHMCVTNAMRDFLREELGIEDAVVVKDKAADRFRDAAAVAEGPRAFWTRERPAAALRASPVARENDVCDRFLKGTHACMTKNKPRFVVSSTSWTPDEDFDVLLHAAVEYDERSRRHKETDVAKYPDLVVIITGKGPQREMYERKMNELTLERVAFRTVWLHPDDYPGALANAHVGVCLHTSSSGLDLPMKVLDMFGASLPVLAARYDVVRELVSEGVDGVLFGSYLELADALVKLCHGHRLVLQGLKFGAAERGKETWRENWRATAAPLFA